MHPKALLPLCRCGGRRLTNIVSSLPARSDNAMAHFEIYVLNYNGSSFLPACLDSLRAVERRGHSCEINVVDNGSSDESEALVRDRYPEVRFIAHGENLGFSSGNNRAVQLRRAELKSGGLSVDFQVFLNNDTTVEPGWLLGAAREFEKSDKVGIVGSKSLFMDSFVVLRVRAADGQNRCTEEDIQLNSAWPLCGDNVHTELGRSKIPHCYPLSPDRLGFVAGSTLYLAAIDSSKPLEIELSLGCDELSKTNVILESCNASGQFEELARLSLRPGIDANKKLSFEPDEFLRLVQNAGSYVLPSWDAGDRGFLEVDHGQFEDACDVDAACGVSLFIRDELFMRLGGYDQKYFAYFEDTDLSLRARLLGYRCRYTPASVLNHVHCGSGVEHSDYFVRNVTYSHLIFRSKLMPKREWRSVLDEYRSLAYQQFAQYETDRSFEGKPHLRSYLRYLKSYPYFLGNRLFRARTHPNRVLFPVEQVQ